MDTPTDSQDAFFGLHCDIARGAYLKPDTFREALDLSAAAGFAHFLPYLENMIRLPSMSRACPDCAYTPDDWRGFERHAARRGLELVPHFNVIGHTERILPAYPKLQSPDDPREPDVTRPAYRNWMLDCLAEFCACSDARHFLIGGDEWRAPKALLQSGRDPGRLWADQINVAVEFLHERGRTPIVWHDMLHHFPQTLDWVSREAVIAFWFYDEDSDYPAISMFREAGFRTLMAGGIVDGHFSRRRVRAAQCALSAARRHRANGFVLTCWEENRWELQKVAIDLMGRLRSGAALPGPVVDALSLDEALARIAPHSDTAATWRARMTALLDAPEWAPYPEAHACLSARLRGDAAADRESYLRHHAAEGALFEKIGKPADAAPVPAATATPPISGAGDFGLTQDSDARLGPHLVFRNGQEGFVLYPKFGASLQAWTVGGATVIPHSLPAFVARLDPAPGGYASYNGAGGLRPIWALGIHQNPNALWQHPFDWKVTTETADEIGVTLEQALPHVAVKYEVRTRRGEPGFTFTAEATNRLPDLVGGFNFNLPLAVDPDDMETIRFEWQDGAAACSRSLVETADSFLVIAAPSGIRIRATAWTLDIGTEPKATAGFYVDWARTYLTPDLHAVYRRLKAGDTTSVHWTFRATT